MIRSGWKVLTHDLRSPVRGGPPIFDGQCPTTLRAVMLDTGGDNCGAGWNYCEAPEAALTIAGLWPTGRPSRLFAVDGSADAIERGDKRRASDARYQAMVLEQHGRCYICGVEQSMLALTVDHDHHTGLVRKLLCGCCNRALGLMRESLRMLRHAADYLEGLGWAMDKQPEK